MNVGTSPISKALAASLAVMAFALASAQGAAAFDATYQRQWGEPTNNASLGFGDTRYLDLTADGTVYFSDSRAASPSYSRIRVYDSNGTQTDSIGQRGTGAQDFGLIRGVAIGPDGHIFVAESGTTSTSTIVELSADGDTWLDTFGAGTSSATPPAGTFRATGDIDVDAAGNVYVADPTADLISKFDTNGDYVTRFGGPGSNPSNVNDLGGIAVSPDGHVHAVDVKFSYSSSTGYTRDTRIVEFASDGAYVGEWGNSADDRFAELAQTSDLVFDPNGFAYVTDAYAYVGAGLNPDDVVKVFNPSRQMVHRFGAYGENGQAGTWDLPTGIGIDGSGGVYVADSGNRRIVKFKLAASRPTFTGTTPESPAQETSIRIKGTADPGSTVSLYAGSCSGAPVATGTAAEFADPGLAVTVAESSTTTFRATATSSNGGASACSTDLISYTESTNPPEEPVITGITPVGPANDNSPKVRGTAPNASAVLLYGDAACTQLVGLGTPATFADPGIGASVADDSTTTIYAKGVRGSISSPCSTTSVTYVEDSTAPEAPQLTGTSPASPSSDEQPLVLGTAEAGATISLHSAAECAGDPLATGSAAELADPGIRVTVPSDATTELYAKATDAAGNSACTPAPLTYVEDSTPPSAPVFEGSFPASPADDNQPFVRGTADEGSTVTLYAGASCTGTVLASGTATEFADPGLRLTLEDDTTVTVYAEASDAAGNASCAADPLTYEEDSSPPEPPVLTGTTPGSPADDNQPFVLGTAETGSTVSLFTEPGCTGEPVATGSAAELAAPGLRVAVEDDTTTEFYASASDWNGDSGCSEVPLTYVEDSTPDECPPGQVGAAPDCRVPPPQRCPAGQAGTPPDCRAVEQPPIEQPPNQQPPNEQPSAGPRLTTSKPRGPALKPGATVTVSLTVTNTGDATARGVKACAKVPPKLRKRLRPKGCDRLGAIPAGKSRVAKLKLRASKRARGKAKVTFRVSAANARPAVAARTFRTRSG